MIPTGSLSGTFVVPITGDAVVERDENFTVVLSRPSSGAKIDRGTVRTTITNDDVASTTTTNVIESAVSATLGRDQTNLTLTGTGRINGTGNDAANVIRGNTAANRLAGRAGADELYGDAGDDQLQGDAGNDVLVGGEGRDRLLGGNGADQFKFTQPTEGGDNISDFHASEGDKLAFVSQNFGGLAVGALTAANFSSSRYGVATTADQRFLFNTKSHLLKYDSDGNGAAAPVTIATLNGASRLSADQIQIVAG
ncbi:MAG: calcium-binding protein [Magnetococcales bacterium]|nr:calcium-binding protein [Magnetococcales bacterium]